jgi:ubiquinone/menaquinone biosynthesis C-methylase UbiE
MRWRVVAPEVRQQYQTTDPLRTRIETHARYSERQIDLNAACRAALGVSGGEALLDVGCGPGDWPRYLRQHGHTGRLAGLDQSAAIIVAATAAAQGLGIEWFTGVADALPFPGRPFNIITARHMLYHVPDIAAALREFARVVGTGGTLLATTNSHRDMPHIMSLKDDMIAHFGLPVILSTSLAFGIENAPGILRAVFAQVDETILTNAFVFTTPEPIAAYIMSMMTMQQTADDRPLYNAIHAWLQSEATRRLAAMNGIWRDPKDVGLYRCRG